MALAKDKLSKEDEFELIANKAIKLAEELDAPFDDFVDGLETMITIFNERLEEAREEQASKESALAEDDGDE